MSEARWPWFVSLCLRHRHLAGGVSLSILVILQSLKGSKGKTFTELTDDVVKIIRKTMPDFKRSIPWYTISIRLDLETRGIVETFTQKGKKLNRLKASTPQGK